MNRLLPKIYTIIAGLTAFIFFGVVIFGVLHSGMQMNKDGQMSNCPFSTGAVCEMNFNEHISAWQNTLTAIPQSINLIKIITGTLLTSIILLIGYYQILFLSKRISFLSRQYIQHVFYIYNSIQEFFIRGILNPKIF